MTRACLGLAICLVFAIISFVLFGLCMPIAIIQGCVSQEQRGPFPTVSPDLLVGIWQADYSAYPGLAFYGENFRGVETLILNTDGTYRQTYDDREGHLYTSPGSTWYIQDCQLYLEGGRYYPLGPEMADLFATGQAGGSFFYDEQKGEWDFTFRMSQRMRVILDIKPCPPRGDRVVLRYPGVGPDPDLPVFVELQRVNMAAPSPVEP